MLLISLAPDLSALVVGWVRARFVYYQVVAVIQIGRLFDLIHTVYSYFLFCQIFFTYFRVMAI